MKDALDDHEGTVNIAGKTITNLRFDDDIDDLAGEEELEKLVERLGEARTPYGIEISAEKTKFIYYFFFLHLLLSTVLFH